MKAIGMPIYLLCLAVIASRVTLSISFYDLRRAVNAQDAFVVVFASAGTGEGR